MLQSKNLSLASQMTCSAASGGATGAVATGVLLFSGTTFAGPGIAAVDSANDGTLISIVLPGVFVVSCGFLAVGAGDVAFGCSVNQTTNFTLDPSYGTPGVRVVLAATQIPAAMNVPCTFSTPITITRALAGQLGGSVLRFLATDANDGAPATIAAGSAWCRVEQVAECYF